MKRFKNLAERTAQRIFATLGVTPTPAQRAATIDMIEQQLVENSVATRQWCADHAVQSTATGHRLAEELHTRHEALIANLSSLR
jgi:hypothetical protein